MKNEYHAGVIRQKGHLQAQKEPYMSSMQGTVRTVTQSIQSFAAQHKNKQTYEMRWRQVLHRLADKRQKKSLKTYLDGAAGQTELKAKWWELMNLTEYTACLRAHGYTAQWSWINFQKIIVKANLANLMNRHDSTASREIGNIGQKYCQTSFFIK